VVRTAAIASLILLTHLRAFSESVPKNPRDTQGKDVVLEWNRAFLKAIQRETTPPPLASRNLAILHVAMFDAVNSIDDRYQSFHLKVSTNTSADIRTGANAAGYAVALGLYPSQRGDFDTLYNELLGAIDLNNASKTEGIRIGKAVAEGILNWRSADGSSTSLTYIPRSQPGEWRRTPPYFRPPEMPGWKLVKPFGIKSCSQFRPKGPPKLESREWAEDYNQVKDLGGAESTKRTADQTESAIFWSDFSYTVTPPGHWNTIARDVAEKRGNDLVANARLFALLNVAMADSCIAGWDAKYEFNWWRPVTAIREGDRDGNDATAADKNWVPLLQTPPFPEYVSGHAAFSGAAAEILKEFFGSDQIEFAVSSDGLPGVTKHFESFKAAADEIGWSRIYGGIHFWSADKDGLKMGEEIATFIHKNYFKALR
jgi:hypothetical protein